MAIAIAEKDRIILKYLENVKKNIENGSKLPPLPKGIKPEDLPPTTRTLVEMMKGKVPKGDF